MSVCRLFGCSSHSLITSHITVGAHGSGKGKRLGIVNDASTIICCRLGGSGRQTGTNCSLSHFRSRGSAKLENKIGYFKT